MALYKLDVAVTIVFIVLLSHGTVPAQLLPSQVGHSTDIHDSGRSSDELRSLGFAGGDHWIASGRGETGERPNHDAPWSWQMLPEGLLWHSYAAAPKEPRFSSAFLYDADGGWLWDSTLGGRVGILRYGTPGGRRPAGLQWDLEGAAMPRLDMLHAQDLESVDFRIGTQLTAAEGPWSFKLGYFHLSSHVGDEYLVRNPGFERVNYVTESAIAGVSLQATDELRTYGEAAYAFHRDGGAGQWQFQTGFEYALTARRSGHGAPFLAANLDMRQGVDFDPALNVLTGWQWREPESNRTLRIGLQYYYGKSSQFEFFRRRDEQLGLGIWFDY